MNVSSVSNWLGRLKARQVPAGSWAEQRRNEALELIASARDGDTWITLSHHDNGFVREVAVRALCAEQTPQALQALIERLNDWVPQVRELAKAGIQPYLTGAHVTSLLCALESVVALAARRRVDHAATLEQVCAVLQGAQARREVHLDFLTRQGKTARFLFARLLEADTEPATLLRDALAHRELTVRLAAAAACQALPAAQAVPLLVRALPHAAAKVRVCVLRALLPLLDDPQPLLRQVLLDASPAIRSLARWQAPRYGVDAAAVLAARLAGEMPTTKRDWLGVLGLGAELQVELPLAWWRAALKSRYPSVRFAAVHQAGEATAGELFGLLGDPSDKVFAAIIVQLGKLPWATVNVEASAWLDRHWHECPAPRRLAVLHLLSGWQQVAYLLQRLDAEPVLQAGWLQEISGWCDRQYRIIDPATSPTARALLVARLQGLVTTGLVRAQQVARVIA